MKLAYVDESGDGGSAPGSSRMFCLSCVIVDSERWPDCFDSLLDFRRHLRDAFGVRIRDEIKANNLLRNNGPFTGLGLGDDIRRRIYRGFMRMEPKMGLQTFAIVIQKTKLAPGRDPVEIAWEYLLQRLERYSKHEGQTVMILYDEGPTMVRKLARKARRAGTAGSAFGTGSLKRPFKLLVEDPVPKNSRDSYFIQLADLNSMAAFRHVVPPPRTTVISDRTWEELGESRLAAVSSYSGGPRGIVVWPQ